MEIPAKTIIDMQRQVEACSAYIDALTQGCRSPEKVNTLLDAAMQQALAGRKYPNVTVYTVHAEPRRNAGSWDIATVPGSKPPFTFHDHRRKDAAMAYEADGGFMIWDGKSRGTFINMVELLGLGKLVEVWLTEKQRSLTLHTLEELAALFPENAGENIWISKDEQAAFLRQFMPSRSMSAPMIK